MSTFVQLCTFSSIPGKFNAKEDTRTINKILRILQKNGAKIVSITPAIGGQPLMATAVYVITYEASEAAQIPIDVLDP